MLKIYDIGARELRASCVFEYKGFFVICSTVFAPNNNVVVFNSPSYGKQVSPEFFRVEDALAWVDAQDNGRRMMEGAQR